VPESVSTARWIGTCSSLRRWHAHEPGVVAEMAAHLAGDGGYGVAEEVGAAVGVEPFEGVEQADGADLFQVRGGFTASAVAAGDVLHDGEVAGDELTAQDAAAFVVGRNGVFGHQWFEVIVRARCGRVRAGLLM
jgi:hypothetical protein